MEAYAAQEAAREALQVAFVRETRLSQQMDLLEERAADSIEVEARSFLELEEQGRICAMDFSIFSNSLDLAP